MSAAARLSSLSSHLLPSSSTAKARVAVDIGGTFTDVALERVGHDRVTTKVLTTFDEPELAVLAAVDQALGRAGISPGDVEVVIHGTTLATNAILQRNGAKTALITTEGFRDVLDIAYESRCEL